MALVQLLITAPARNSTDLQNVLRPTTGAARQSVNRIMRLLTQLRAGRTQDSTIKLRVAPDQATATLTFTDQPVADETFVLCGVTFTAKGGDAAGAAEWDLTSGGTAAADAAGNAASVAALVNAHPTVSAFVTAAAVLGVVTFTVIEPGLAGNGFVLSESLTNATVVTFAGGTNGTQTSLSL